MKKYFLLILLLYMFSCGFLEASSITATGFIPGQIWYSKDVITEGDSIYIYTAVWNSAVSPLSAKVEFYDQNVILGTRDIIVQPQELKETSVPWKVTSGDHIISAKIISPSVTVSGKKQTVSVDNSSTEASRKFVPVVIKTADGDLATSADLVKSQIDKATLSIEDILPEKVSLPIIDKLDSVSNFREGVSTDISEMKNEARRTIDEISKIEENLKNTSSGKINTKVNNANKNGLDDPTKKPITYVKLFLLSILGFIFANNFIFYSLVVLVCFLVLRWIYLKIRNR